MSHHTKNNSLSEEVFEKTSVSSAKCYQCGKCSAGCPLAEDMDYTSSMVMRMLQTEDPDMEKALLKSQSIWLCVSCEMCIARCPMSIDIPKVMDYLRQKAVEKRLQNKKADKNIVAFHRSFLDMIKYTGRSYEAGMIVDYKLRSKDLFQDLTLAPKMISRGKLSFFPELIKNRKNIKDIFKKSKKA